MSEDEDWAPPEDEWTPPTEAEMKVLAARRERSDKISKLMGDYLLKGFKMLASSCPQCMTVELQDRQGAKYCVACQEVDCHETSKDNPAISQIAASRGIAEEAFSTSQGSQSGRSAGGQSKDTGSGRQPRDTGSNGQSRDMGSSGQSLAGGQSSTGGSGQQGTGGIVGAGSNPDLIPRLGEETGAVARPARRQQLETRQVQSVSVSPTPAARASLQHVQGGDGYQAVLASSLGYVVDKLAWASSQLASSTSPERDLQLVVLVRECATTAQILSGQLGTQL